MAPRKPAVVAPVEPPKGFKKILTDKIVKALEEFRVLVSTPIQNDAEATKFEAAMLWAMGRQKLHNSLLDPVIQREKASLDETRAQKAAVNGPYATVESLSREALRTYRTQKEIERQRLLRLPSPSSWRPTAPPPPVVDDDIPAPPAGMVISDTHTLPVMPVLDPVVTAAPAETTIPMQKVWKWTTTDVMALVKFVAEGKLPIDILSVNESRLNEYAKELEEQMNTWPGGEATYEMRPIGRAKGPRG